MSFYQGLLFAEALGGKLVDGVGQNRSIILGDSIGAVGLVATGVDLDMVVPIAVGRVGVLIRGARAGAGVVIVIVVIITSNVDIGAACVARSTSVAANEATDDARSGIKDVGDDVAGAVARGVKEAISGHLHLLHHLALIHHLSIIGLLSLLLE